MHLTQEMHFFLSVLVKMNWWFSW